MSQTLEMLARHRKRGHIAEIAWEHAVPFGLYAVLSVAVTWPLARDFATRLTGSIPYDQIHSLWLLSHFRQWLAGIEPLFSSTSLYYPIGSSLLLDGVGPVSGLLALPFSWHGPIAGYNGAVLLGFALSGYCMYLLARGIGVSRGVAFVSGVILLMAPPHMVSAYGHLERTFIGLPALALLGLHRALHSRSWWWAIVTATLLLLTALCTASQLVFTAFASAILALAALATAAPDERPLLIRRGAILGACCLVIVGPYLAAVHVVANDPAYFIKLGEFAPYYSPDASQFVLPSSYSALLGFPVEWIDSRQHAGMDIAVETAVGISWTAIALCLVALRSREARPWLVCGLCLIAVSLGPSLRFLGRTTFTNYDLPIILPYAFLASIPGLDVFRVSGRFMIVGMVAVAAAAGWGLQNVVERAPRMRRFLIVGTLAIVLLEQWPEPWEQWDPESKFATPRFYQLIAHDRTRYGVLDLPLLWPPGQQDVAYQWHQLTHGKSIAWGYLSRPYRTHPIQLLSRALQAGPLAGPASAGVGSLGDAKGELQRLGYRYVVWHKTYSEMPTALRSNAFIDLVFGAAATPYFEDELVRVYEVPPVAVGP